MIVGAIGLVLGMGGLAVAIKVVLGAIDTSGELPGSLTVRELSEEQLDLDRDRMHVVRGGKA